jgi:folylpolyglutamate synthase/dihydropteroate synthase
MYRHTRMLRKQARAAAAATDRNVAVSPTPTHAKVPALSSDSPVAGQAAPHGNLGVHQDVQNGARQHMVKDTLSHPQAKSAVSTQLEGWIWPGRIRCGKGRGHPLLDVATTCDASPYQ